MAFKTAARIAFKQLDKASPVLLEPVHRVEILVPDENMGDIMGDLNKRRGRIMGMDKVGELQCITAEVPEGEMYKYATDLLAMTEGRGSFSMSFERYEEVPAADAKKIIESVKREDEDDE
jgi:elongation factor G